MIDKTASRSDGFVGFCGGPRDQSPCQYIPFWAIKRLVPTSQQFIEGSDNFIALLLQRTNEFPLRGGDDFERMRDDQLTFDSKRRRNGG